MYVSTHSNITASRSLHESVDWNTQGLASTQTYIMSLSSRERGLKHDIELDELELIVALFTRAWIETTVLTCKFACLIGRSLHESVDWNQLLQVSSKAIFKVALFTRAWIETCKYKDNYHN